MAGLLEMERRLWAEGYARVAGVDEVGVGCLAGPVVAAAVIFPAGTTFEGVDDSKRLNEHQRLSLLPIIESKACAITLGIAEVQEINKLNVYHASVLAMQRAVQGLPQRPDCVLVDARQLPDLSVRQHSVIRGDRSHFCIAAASVVAKTFRDDLMRKLDKEFPEYGLARNKGYCTKFHRRALQEHGCSPIHRSSYAFLRGLSGNFSAAYLALSLELEGAVVLAEVSRISRVLQQEQASLSRFEFEKLRKRIRERRAVLAHQKQFSLF